MSTLIIAGNGTPDHIANSPVNTLSEALTAKGHSVIIAYDIGQALNHFHDPEHLSSVFVTDAFALTPELIDHLQYFKNTYHGRIILGGDMVNALDIDKVNYAFDILGMDWSVAASAHVAVIANINTNITLQDTCPAVFNAHAVLVNHHTSNDAIIYGVFGNFRGYAAAIQQDNVAWIGFNSITTPGFAEILLSVLPAPVPAPAPAAIQHLADANNDDVDDISWPSPTNSYIKGKHERAEGWKFGVEQEVTSLREEMDVLVRELAAARVDAKYWYDMTIAAPVCDHDAGWD